jgi:hypothetical protein
MLLPRNYELSPDLSPNEKALISYGPPAQSYEGLNGIKHAQVARIDGFCWQFSTS